MAGLGVSAEAGRLKGDVAMETNRGIGETVAVGGDDSTLAAREELAAIGHPGAAGHLEERAGTVNEERPGSWRAIASGKLVITSKIWIYMTGLEAPVPISRIFFIDRLPKSTFKSDTYLFCIYNCLIFAYS